MEGSADNVWIVSRCLLGEPCRYDGASKANGAVRSFLESRGCRVLTVCPECDCGMGCPRSPLTVRDVQGELHLTDESGEEHLGQMRSWLSGVLDAWPHESVVGFLLKARSPSCGVGDVLIAGRELPGDGVFASAVREAFPGVPVMSEKDIAGGWTPYSGEVLLSKVESCMRSLLMNTPACHDWDHTLRVLNNARAILSALSAEDLRQGCDVQVVETAALMHDIGRLRELEDRGRTDHAVYGAMLAGRWLTALGVTDSAFIRHVSDCVRTHRFRRRAGSEAPQSLEARIVYDADKLDSIGAIGIGRSFHFAGRCGARVHNRFDEAVGSESYSREDSAYREYLVKLRHVQGSMLTDAGRRLAHKRARFMEAFFEELNEECGFDAQSEKEK